MALGDFVELKRGYDLPSRERRAGTHPLVSSSGITELVSEAKVAGPGVVTGRYGTVGQVFYVPTAFWPLNTTLYVRDFKGNDARFVYYFLQLIDWAKFNDKSGVPGINRNDVHREMVTVPPLEHQEGIAATLGALDDKIELNRRMNETLEATAQAIFRDWFVDFGPVRRKLAGATDPVEIMGGVTTDPEQAAELASLFPDALGDGEVPVGWAPQRLDELASLSRVAINPLSFPDETFEHYSLPAYDDGQRPVLDAGETIKSNKSVVPVGSVLLSKLNPEIPRVWLPNPPSGMRQVASTEFLVFEPKGGVGRALLYFLFRDRTVRQTLESMVTGTSKSHQRVSPPALLQSTLLVAASPCVAAFGKIAEPIVERCLALRAENHTLAETRDYLLPRLMSGEVRVCDAAQEIAA